jgi:hypothetical protein
MIAAGTDDLSQPDLRSGALKLLSRARRIQASFVSRAAIVLGSSPRAVDRQKKPAIRGGLQWWLVNIYRSVRGSALMFITTSQFSTARNA